MSTSWHRNDSVVPFGAPSRASTGLEYIWQEVSPTNQDKSWGNTVNFRIPVNTGSYLLKCVLCVTLPSGTGTDTNDDHDHVVADGLSLFKQINMLYNSSLIESIPVQEYGPTMEYYLNGDEAERAQINSCRRIDTPHNFTGTGEPGSPPRVNYISLPFAFSRDIRTALATSTLSNEIDLELVLADQAKTLRWKPGDATDPSNITWSGLTKLTMRCLFVRLPTATTNAVINSSRSGRIQVPMTRLRAQSYTLPAGLTEHTIDLTHFQNTLCRELIFVVRDTDSTADNNVLKDFHVRPNEYLPVETFSFKGNGTDIYCRVPVEHEFAINVVNPLHHPGWTGHGDPYATHHNLTAGTSAADRPLGDAMRARRKAIYTVPASITPEEFHDQSGHIDFTRIASPQLVLKFASAPNTARVDVYAYEANSLLVSNGSIRTLFYG